MTDTLKQPTPAPKFGFLLDELHRQGFLVGIGDMLKVRRYFNMLLGKPLSINDLKAQLGVLVCQNPQDQKRFYDWFDKWAVVIAARTENLIAQLEPIEKAIVIDPQNPKLDPQNVAPPPPPPPPVTHKTESNKWIKSEAKSKRVGPINIQLAFPPNPIRFWNLSEFDPVLPILREKKWVESADWDIAASIKQTIQSGGVPKFVLKQKRQTPQYLMLIEQQSVRDHLAAFYADLAEELSRRDLNVTYYYYDISPSLCWRERNNPKTHVSLEQLQGEFGDARLFIVGNADTLLKPTQLEPSAVAMSIWETWKETAVLSPKGTNDWGKAELAIGQLFPVIPINGRGFQSLVAQWQGSEHFTPAYWQRESPEPRTPNVAQFYVSERPKTSDTEGSLSLPSWKTVTPDDENQLNLLYFYLRDGGYRWLCAAALYPEIYYELTRLYADEVLTKDQNLSEWAQNSLWTEHLRLLLRLDWFRKGQIPTHWRGLLRDDFTVEKALALQNDPFVACVKAVRGQLLKVLKLPANTEGVPQNSYAAANQAFTQVWVQSEIDNNLGDIPQKMGNLDISMSDIEDAVGQELWFVEGQKGATETTLEKMIYQSGACWWLKNTGKVADNPSISIKTGTDAKVEEAWALLGNLGSPNITVAVVDNGFDLENPILKNRAYRPYDLRASSSALPSGDPNYTHGTAIASLAIGSQLANFSGVAPNVRFMPLHGTGFSVESAENIFNYTIRNDADVVVCAWGSIDDNFKLDADKISAIAKAAKDGRQGKGCVILFAAGNEGVDYVNYYAQHPDVICVGSTTSEDEHPDYANTGPEMTVCAVSNGGYAPLLAARASWDKGIEGEEGAAKFYYGDGIDRGEFMQHFGGTSGSVAIVGGVCALILSANPNLTAKEVKEILAQTADKVGAPSEYDEKGHSIKFGYGRVNAAAAVAEALRRLNSSQAQNVENEAIMEEKRPLSKKPEKGYLRFYVPNQAELGKKYRCHVFLAYEAAQLVDTIKNTTDFMEKTIHMSETMTVELTNSTEPPAFKIRALSANTQLIDESSPTEWQFLMTPLHENNQSLVLSITKIEHIDNKEKRKTVVYEQNVEVIAPTEKKKEAEVEYLGPMDEETKQQIRDLISRAKLEEAIDRFKKWADENGDEDLKNTLLMLSAKFNNFQRNQNMGLIDAKDANMERNQINAAVLSLLDEAKIVKPKAKPASETPPKGDNDSEKEGKTILFMGATPHGVGSLQLEIEHSKIAVTLNDKFNFPVAKFLKADEMPKLFIQHKPNIVHFSVSGKNSESDNDSNVEQDKSRTLGYLPEDYAKKGGIVVFSEDMRSLQIIEDKVLDYLFSSAVNKLRIPIEVVVLSRCFSESQAKIIGKYVPYVVGTMNTIDDKSAIEFAEGFYSGISKGLTIEDAYTSGKMQAVIQDVEAEDLFMIYKKGENMKL